MVRWDEEPKINKNYSIYEMSLYQGQYLPLFIDKKKNKKKNKKKKDKDYNKNTKKYDDEDDKKVSKPNCNYCYYAQEYNTNIYEYFLLLVKKLIINIYIKKDIYTISNTKDGCINNSPNMHQSRKCSIYSTNNRECITYRRNADRICKWSIIKCY
jgi:hypothetical protein